MPDLAALERAVVEACWGVVDAHETFLVRGGEGEEAAKPAVDVALAEVSAAVVALERARHPMQVEEPRG